MPTLMYESRAWGGPLDSIKLSAPLSWNGLVPMTKRNENEATRFHPGKYMWQETNDQWVWYAAPEGTYCRYDPSKKRTAHRWHPNARRGERCFCYGFVLLRAHA